LLIEKSTYILYWTPPSWFHAVNRLETGSQGLFRTGFGFANGIRPQFIRWREKSQTNNDRRPDTDINSGAKRHLPWRRCTTAAGATVDHL